MARVAHLTTVHSPFDNRILERECRTLVEAGYEVVLVAGHPCREVVSGVRLRGVRWPRGRAARMTLGVLRVLVAALAERPAVFHIHDLELILAGLILRLLRRRVIYDVHEDYATALLEREYLPPRWRPVLSRILSGLEGWCSRHFELVLAERYYAERFPRGTLVLNYVRFPEVSEAALEARPREPGVRLLYTGNVKEYRGAFLHAGLLNLLPEAQVHLVGRCTLELAEELRRAVAGHEDRLHLEGIGYLVPHARIQEYYLREVWTAGLAIFPRRAHTARKELTKIFEYMAYGIPVLASDLPGLRRIVETEGCGLCVDPDEPRAAAEAAAWLAAHPEEARAMGARGRAAARQRYSWEGEGARLVSLYARLCSGNGPAGDAASTSR
jgi:glycosyltransferase involved in cell wall biosynthesis